MSRHAAAWSRIPSASVRAVISPCVPLLVTLLSCWTSPVFSQTEPHPWVQLARGDLAAIHEALLENHPGPVDPLNPSYRNWLENGYRRALAMADSVESLDGLMAVLSFYTSGFDDGHLGWDASYERTAALWPGFVVALRNDRFVVDHVAPWAAKAGIAPAAEVLSCDGRSLHDRLVDDVMAFHEGIPALEASRVRLAPRLLIDDANPFVTRPRRCRLRTNATAVASQLELTWRRIGREALDSLLTRAAYGSGVDEYRILHPADGVAWITIPSFNETAGDNRSGLERVIAGLPEVRDADLIVFDVRGNRGGNSAWGRRLLIPLFGEEYLDDVRAELSGEQYVEWRASAGNADFVERSTLPRFEPGSEGRKWMEALIAALREGVESGQDLVRLGDDEAPQPEAPREALAPHPLAPRVILLTDGWCASACLDFADLLLAIPGVRHAGSPTYADAVYIDNRSGRLPSRLGLFGFSMKVYRNRARGHNQPYVPSLEYTGERWEMGALQQWLLRVAR